MAYYDGLDRKMAYTESDFLTLVGEDTKDNSLLGEWMQDAVRSLNRSGYVLEDVEVSPVNGSHILNDSNTRQSFGHRVFAVFRSSKKSQPAYAVLSYSTNGLSEPYTQEFRLSIPNKSSDGGIENVVIDSSQGEDTVRGDVGRVVSDLVGTTYI